MYGLLKVIVLSVIYSPGEFSFGKKVEHKLHSSRMGSNLSANRIFNIWTSFDHGVTKASKFIVFTHDWLKRQQSDQIVLKHFNHEHLYKSTFKGTPLPRFVFVAGI